MMKTTYKCTEMTKERLLQAIIALVQKKGYKNVTVRDICKEAGVSNGAFYHHFGSKDALTKAAYCNLDRILTPKVIADCKTLSPLDGLHLLLEQQIRYVSEDVGIVTKEYYRVLLEGDNVSTFNSDRPYFQAVRRQVECCIHEHSMTLTANSYDLTKYILRYIRGLIVDWCIDGGHYNLLEQFNLDFSNLIHGLL